MNRLSDLPADGVSSLFLETQEGWRAWGDRLHHFQKPLPANPLHGELGQIALGDPRHTRWEFEVVFHDSPDDDALKRIIGLAIAPDADECLLDELVRAYRSEGTKRPTAIDRTLPVLFELGVHRLDFHLATVWVDAGFQFCVRPVRAFWTSQWLLTLWGPPGDSVLDTPPFLVRPKWDWESEDARSAALPARRPAHLPAGLPDTVGGLDAVIRLAYFVVGHHQWSVGRIGESLERWQSKFFEEAGDGRGADPLELMAPLSDVGRSIVMMRVALERTRSALKSPPFRHHERLGKAADRDANDLGRAGGEVRDAYVLGASAASLYQAFQAEGKIAADRKLQGIASFIAAFVLWPGFVATLYGANVDGLPGGKTHGLLVLSIASAIGALLILVALLLVLKRGRN